MLKPAAAFLVLFALTAPSAAQDPGDWRAAEGDRFLLSWTYDFTRKEKSHAGPNDEADHREVEALLVPEEAFQRTGRFTVELQKVRWTRESEQFHVELSFDRAGSGEIEIQAKPEGEPAVNEAIDAMRAQVEGTYRLLVRSGSASLQVQVGRAWSGGSAAPSLFDSCYLHSDLPDELESGTKWECERETDALPIYGYPGKFEEFPSVVLRLIKANANAGVKASGSGKVNYTGRDLQDRTYKGKTSIKRSFEIAGAGHLAVSHEEATSALTKKDLGKLVIAGKVSIKQDLSLTKQ